MSKAFISNWINDYDSPLQLVRASEGEVVLRLGRHSLSLLVDQDDKPQVRCLCVCA
jgi:hypothetical protein